MTWLLQVVLIVLSVAFLVFVLLMVRRERFMLKYSIIWVVLGILGLLAACFPAGVYWLSDHLGFDVPVNFVFLVCILFLFAVSFMFVATLSKQSVLIKELIQEVSLLKMELHERGGLDDEAGSFDDAEGAAEKKAQLD